MIENVLHTEDFEGQGHHENVVRRIASLQNVEPVAKEDPPGIEEFPEKSRAVLPGVPQRAVAFGGHGMPVDAHPINHFIALLVTLAARTQDGYLVTLLE